MALPHLGCALRIGPLALLLGFLPIVVAQATGTPTEAEETDPLQALVKADWQLQEQRLGRQPHSPAAVHAALDRARRLLSDLHSVAGAESFASDSAVLEAWSAQAQTLGPDSEAAWLDLYVAIRSFTRQRALNNPLVTRHPILFMERRRAVGYMLYEYLGWYYVHGNDPTSGFKNPRYPTPEPGGGLYLLEQPGRSLRTRALTAGQFPPGHYMTLSLSADAGTIYFAFADPTGRDPYTLPGYGPVNAPDAVACNLPLVRHERRWIAPPPDQLRPVR
jgi:hypothetical protein